MSNRNYLISSQNCSYSESPKSTGTYYTPLERHFCREYNAIEIVIVANGSSSYGVNPGTRFTDLDPERDLPLFPCLGLLAAQLAMYKYLRCCYGFSQKGDGLFHSRSLWKLQR